MAVACGGRPLRAQCPAHRPGRPLSPAGGAAGLALLRAPGEAQHVILVPLRRLSGLEDPTLWREGQPNWFGLAWRQRWLLSATAAGPVPDSAVGLALNAPSGRSQDQLHVHLACVRPLLRQRLLDVAPSLSEHWRRLPFTLAGGHYWGRRIAEQTLLADDFFAALAAAPPYGPLPDARLSLALVPLPSTDTSRVFLLLAGQAGSTPRDYGSSQRLLAPRCPGTPSQTPTP